jgi:uncharacterized protein DUF4242
MDVHSGMTGVANESLAQAHAADLAVHKDEGVSFRRAWVDPGTGVVFCLWEAPTAEAVQRIHQRAGHPADAIHEVSVNGGRCQTAGHGGEGSIRL